MDDLSKLENGLLSDRPLPYDRFFGWMHGICVVTFDLELGQAIESIYPGHSQVPANQRHRLSFESCINQA